MKVFIVLLSVLIAVQAGPKGSKVGPAVKANRDCTCVGYDALAKECNWTGALAKCDVNSKAYEHYKNKCERINKFRDGKRKGEIANTYDRKMQCNAYMSSEKRIKQRTGYVEDVPKPQKRSLPQYINNDNTFTFNGMPPLKSGPALPAGTVSFNAPIKTSVNWTSQFTPIKNQGNCGSCWIFASVGMCEWYMKNISPQVPVILGEQCLVDCYSPTVNGCNGGDLKNSWNYIANNGIAGSAYTYTASYTPNTCKSPSIHTQAWKCPKPIQEYWPNGNDTRLRQIVSQFPVAVSFKVMDDLMQYKSGVYVPTQVCDASVNHAVILAGFGYDTVLKKNYWLIRNSWGSNNGEYGYYRLDADKPFQCGISRKIAYFPKV